VKPERDNDRGRKQQSPGNDMRRCQQGDGPGRNGVAQDGVFGQVRACAQENLHDEQNPDGLRGPLDLFHPIAILENIRCQQKNNDGNQSSE
jgi:hypothetical protein